MDKLFGIKAGNANGRAYFLVLFLLVFVWPILASDNIADPNTGNASSSSSADLIESELLLFEEMPMVYSASRSAQRADELSVAVNVITAEDIHYGGFTSVPEILSYSLGVDIFPYSRNGYRMSMGGVWFSIFDRNVVMINGRNLNSPVSGGTDFANIPIFVEDIERIEIVRSTGGAAWGTNAFSGVINIVTKKPEDVKGFMYSGTLNHYGDIYNQLRWAESAGGWRWRVSGGYDDWTATENTTDRDVFSSNDFSRAKKFDSEAMTSLTDLVDLSLGAAYIDSQNGSVFQPTLSTFYDPTAPFVKYDSHYKSQRYFAKLARKKYEDYSLHLQWYGNFTHNDNYSGFKNRWMENDLEAQLDYDLDDHNLIVGTDFKQNQIESLQDQYSFKFADSQYNDYQAGLFLIDRWSVNEDLTLEGQLRDDYFSDTKDTDWSGRFSIVQKIFDSYDQRVRLSVARAFRTPSYGWRYSSYFNVYTDPETRNEEVVSYEAGYSIKPYNFLSLHLDGYARKYTNMIGAYGGYDPATGPFVMVSNSSDIDVLGSAVKAVLDYKDTKAELWVSYEDVELTQVPYSQEATYPIGFKFGVNGRQKLSEEWVFSANLKFNETQCTQYGNRDFDEITFSTIALTRLFPKDRGDLTVGIMNLFDNDYNLWQNSGENWDSVGRTFFGRLQLKF